MNLTRISKIALLLWVTTIVIFGWFFFRGFTTAGSDGRTAVILQPAERDFVLNEMRRLLSATQGILEGANQGDVQRIIKVARSAGMAGAADASPLLITKLPIEFKQLAMSMHRDMDEIAKAGEGGLPASELLKMTSNALKKCISCHAAWQIKTSN